MGYFSNGTAGELYEANHCSLCVHGPIARPDTLCPVWSLHLLHNYADCDKPDSMLHALIPLSEDGLGNEQCTMFIERPDALDPRQERLPL